MTYEIRAFWKRLRQRTQKRDGYKNLRATNIFVKNNFFQLLHEVKTFIEASWTDNIHWNKCFLQLFILKVYKFFLFRERKRQREREKERERELSNSIIRLSKQFHACLFFLRKDFALKKSTKMQNKQLSSS